MVTSKQQLAEIAANHAQLESLVHGESAKWLAFYTGHENIIRNQDRRLGDIETGLATLQTGLGVLSDGVRELKEPIADLNAKLDGEHEKYEQHTKWHERIDARVDALEALTPPLDEQKSHTAAHQEFVDTAQAMDERLSRAEKALELVIEAGKANSERVAALERDGGFLDFLRGKFGDDFAASRVGHVDEDIPE